MELHLGWRVFYLLVFMPCGVMREKASWLPAECRSTRCVFNQEEDWESLLVLDVELIAHRP